MYEQFFAIPSSACGADGVCMPPFLLGCLEQTTFADAERIGQGRDYFFQTYNLCWMLVYTDLTVQAPMSARAELTVKTRYCGRRGAMLERELTVFAGGSQTAYAVQHWVVVDRTARTMCNPMQIPELSGLRAPRRDTVRPGRLPDTMRCVGTGQVTRQDIDRNGHMNNARYVERAMPYLPESTLRGTYRLHLTYSYELLEGQNYDCLCTDGTEPFALVFRNGEKECFALRLMRS